MLLTIDVGNTNISFAVFNNDTIIGRWSIATDIHKTTDEYALILSDLFSFKSIKIEDITGTIIASVVPSTLFPLRKLCENYFNCTPIIVNDQEVPIQIDLDQPSEVGADRLVNAVAAYSQFNQACIIVDFGTATNFDVIDSKGTYKGGAIAPGINLSLEALHKAAAKLPKIAIQAPKHVIGKNTEEAMQTGIYWGYVGLIETIVTKCKEELGDTEVKTIATGGLAPLFAKATSIIDHLEPELTIHGLKQIYDKSA